MLLRPRLDMSYAFLGGMEVYEVSRVSLYIDLPTIHLSVYLSICGLTSLFNL